MMVARRRHGGAWQMDSGSYVEPLTMEDMEYLPDDQCLVGNEFYTTPGAGDPDQKNKRRETGGHDRC